MTAQVSKPNRNIDSTTNLKKNPDTRGPSHSLLWVLVILFHTALYKENFLTTTHQSLSSDMITRARYWKEFTISRGHP